MSRGVFITLEGPDGAGKSTQARLLAEALREAGQEVVLTREPGGSTGAEAVRALLVEGEPGRWSAMTELLLFNAARRDHVERTITPALAKGAVVICDRYVDSTRAYQAADRREDGSGVPDATITELHRRCIALDPDLTIILDLTASAAAQRVVGIVNDEDRFERFGLGFQDRVRDAFRRIARAEPDRCIEIDANAVPAVVQARVRTAVRERLSI